jgi:DNA mismatch repair protein MutL
MKIHKLHPQEAQKIAAGEVVERPANILKELLENSLDAGATHIAISVKNGGKDFIDITDNGSGMDLDDALICFHRHTTSKIHSVDQLPSITTFGFRGEALASICSIAKVTLTTKTAENPEGVQLLIENTQVQTKSMVACQTGTTIKIDDIFYNVPARKKFLKSTQTEWSHCLSLFKAYALERPDIHFMLKHDDTLIYNCPPIKTLQERIAQLFEAPLTSAIIPLKSSTQDDITVTGAITTQQYARYDRGGIFFFVNHRWIKNYQLMQAVTKGYLNILPSGRYPAGAINITVNPKTVDSNVHPKKEEVQFLHPKKVQDAITHTVKTTLEQHLSQQLKRSVTVATSIETFKPAFEQPLLFDTQTVQIQPKTYQSVKTHDTSNLLPPFAEPFDDTKTFTYSTEKKEQKAVEQFAHCIGHYHNTYLLLEHKDGLLFVDQHAAHERILYERFVQNFENLPKIKLLFPLTLTYNQETIELLINYFNLFNKHAIEFEQVGKNQLNITAIPVFLNNQPVNELIEEIIGWIKELQGINKLEFHKIITEKLRAKMACKAAIKAGDILTKETIDQLLIDLESSNNRFTCPHGRPTTWLLPLNDIERKFKRKM